MLHYAIRNLMVDAAAAIWSHAIRSLIKRLNPARRQRSNPRVIKRKVSKWLAKRDHHKHWPQPEHIPQIHVQTLN